MFKEWSLPKNLLAWYYSAAMPSLFLYHKYNESSLIQVFNISHFHLSKPFLMFLFLCWFSNRIKCRKEGGVRFTVGGAGIFLSVLIRNVAGAGDITAVKIKGSRTGWLPMGRNWGQNWHINADMKNQPLSFEVTSSDGLTITSYNVAPKSWSFGQTFEGKQFES